MKRLYSIGFLLAILLAGRGGDTVSSAPAGGDVPPGAEIEDTSILLSAPTESTGSVSAAVAAAFCPSMGCYDVDCADASHYHACGAACTDASHYHSCPENCANTAHSHCGQGGSGHHGGHHGGRHRR